MTGAPEGPESREKAIHIATVRQHVDAAWPGTLEDLNELFVTPSPSWRRADSAPALCGEEVFALDESPNGETVLGGGLTGLSKYEKIRGLETGSFGSIAAVRLKQPDGRSRSCHALSRCCEEASTTGRGLDGQEKTYALKTTDLRDVSVESLGLSPKFEADGRRVKRAMTEFRVLFELPGHPLFPRLVDVFTSRCDTLFHLVMDHIHGTDLRTRLNHAPNRRLPEPEARFFAAEMLLALDHLHSNGFLYRDLKPENVMVDEASGHIKLVDFDLVVQDGVAASPLAGFGARCPPQLASSAPAGLCGGGGSAVAAAPPCAPCSFDAAAIAASEVFGTPPLQVLRDISPRAAGRLKVPSTVCGTAEYIAPEVLAGCPCTPASDRWQVGVVLCELLFGASPFRASRPQATFLLIATARVELPDDPEVSPEARSAVLAMLRRTGGWGAPSDPRIRLGGRSLREVQEHPFFAGIEWDGLAGRPPPCAVPPCRNARGEAVASLPRGVEDW